MFFPHWGPRPPSQRYHYPEFGGLSLIHIIMYTYITIHNYICMYAYTAYCLLLLVFEFKKNDIMLVYSLPGFFFSPTFLRVIGVGWSRNSVLFMEAYRSIAWRCGSLWRPSFVGWHVHRVESQISRMCKCFKSSLEMFKFTLCALRPFHFHMNVYQVLSLPFQSAFI